MKKCPYCGNEKKLVNLAQPYLGFGGGMQEATQFKMCEECKKILDKEGIIYLPEKNAGLKSPR